MLPAVSRYRPPGALAAIILFACSAPAHGQEASPAGPSPQPAGPAAAGPVARPAPSTAPVPATPTQGDLLDPGSPLSAMPDLGVDWPDLSQPDAPLGQMPLAPLAPGDAVTLFPAAPDLAPTQIPPPDKHEDTKKEGGKTTEAGGDRRYMLQIQGLQGVSADGLLARFETLSSLKLAEGKPANVAQIGRRAREDAQTLTDLLRAYGYYDAEVDTRIGGAAGPALTIEQQQRLAVTLTVTPGALYTFHSVSLPGLDSTGADEKPLVQAFGVHDGEAVNADKVTAGVAALKLALGQRGYAFAEVPDPQIVVDHDAGAATLVLAVKPGEQMRFGAFHISGSGKIFGAKHVQLISRLHPGDRYDVTRLDDLRRGLIQTGLVSVAQITPVRTSDPKVVDLDVHLEPAPPRTISATLGYVTGARITAGQLGYMATETVSTVGYGTGQGATAEVDWTHRNLFPPEGSLTLRGLLGNQEQLASAIFRRNNFRTRDQTLIAQLTLDHLNVPAFSAKTVDLAAGIERQTNIIWQKEWTYSYGTELVASGERDVIAATGDPRRRTYYVAALPLSLAYDGSDDLLNPTKGYRLAAHVSPEVSFRGKAFTYVRIQLDGSAYQPVGEHLVFAERVRLDSIQGASSDDIAPTRRFYSGGGGSVRGFGYQKIGPRDVDNDPIGGASVAEFGLEARIRFGDFGLVPFLDGGNLYSQSLPDFKGMRYGTGLGFRYYTSFGPVRVDVGTPINRHSGDSRVAVYVSLGQAF